MPSRKPPRETSLAMALLACLAKCREHLKEAAEQFRESRDDEEASRITQETIDFLAQWLKSFQILARSSFVLPMRSTREGHSFQGGAPRRFRPARPMPPEEPA